MYCQKLQKEGSPLKFPPFPGEFGKKIVDNISQEGWETWLGHQTILINEYRLNMMDAEARKFLKDELEKFLFGEGSDVPEQFKPDA
tara:strand:- start:148 stop:405 length:258 start_codon:yes stop_codon:yes gene_type:complete